ncbi:MAG: diacylglycerol kinase family lipid kinase [Actinomycetota bacterium]|nr:NAD(+)/NADH kinase [Acidimicrobiia bacterium]MDQ3293836.1 diacylglycerol kinase family lipid kinase [Actinomycetota bacterium]
MRLLLIVNSSASSVTARGKVVIQKALSADHDVTAVETSRRNHATRLALGAAKDGVDVVVVLGGDGTLNEAANGLVHTETALAALPGGSTNVFARTIGLPNDPIEATGALLDGLAHERIEKVGVGTVNGRAFLFHVGVGFDAAVVEQVERRSQLKRWVSHPLFVFSAFTTWMRHYDRAGSRFEVDGVPGAFTIVLNTNPYSYLGNRPLDLVPEATLDRGLACVHFRSLGLWPLLHAAGGALAGTDIRRQRGLDVRTDLDRVHIASERPFPYQVDGDYLGETTALDLRHEAGALRLVLPARESGG